MFAYYRWNETNNEWTGYNKYEAAYDDNGNNIMSVYYEWDDPTNQWIYSWKTETPYDHDPNGNKTIWISYLWDKKSSQWVVYVKDERTYNASGKTVLVIMSSFDLNTQQWVSNTKQETVYDENDKITLDFFYRWDKTSDEWITSSRWTFYYSDHNFAPENPQIKIIAYPNPASEYIVFNVNGISESAWIEIFDIYGRKALEQKLPVTGQISISKLAKGLYLYRISNNGIVYKGKIIVQNNITN